MQAATTAVGTLMSATEGNKGYSELLDIRFRAPLMTYFAKRVSDRNDAEDLTQEVFVRLVSQTLPLHMATASAFVFTIASNLLRDRARRKASRLAHAHHSLDDPDSNYPDAALIEELEPERVSIARESLREVLTALETLDHPTRHIFILFRIEKMRQRDIASLYGVSIHVIERQIVKATNHLLVRLSGGGLARAKE
jgi:RNA polymerase sigma factor (sigma-70 family)